MKKIFHTYIKKYQFLTPDRLYDNFVKLFETEFTTNDSTIYFVVKCKKPRWVAGSVKFYRNYKFGATIFVDNRLHDVVIDMAEYWYSMPSMAKSFPNKRVMADYFMSRIDRVPWKMLPADLRYKSLSSVQSIEQEGQLLKIHCEIAKNSSAEEKSAVDIFLYQAISFYDLPQPKLDIIYIGSSLKGAFSRVQKHEKWGWLQAQKAPDEDLLVYFCEIAGDQFRMERPVIAREDHELSRQDETLITEMALIHYFKPLKYNDKHVVRDIKHSDRVKAKLIDRGFNQICVEMLLDGSMGKLGSTHVPKYGEHTIFHNIA